MVGAGVFSFARGVETSVRAAVSDTLLLTQLVASRPASADADPLRWFAAYTEALANLGWTVTAGGWTDYAHEMAHCALWRLGRDDPHHARTEW